MFAEAVEKRLQWLVNNTRLDNSPGNSFLHVLCTTLLCYIMFEWFLELFVSTNIVKSFFYYLGTT